MIDDIINSIEENVNQLNQDDENKQPETEPKQEPETKERIVKNKNRKVYKLSEIVDIDTVSFISVDLMNWINRKIIIAGANRMIFKIPGFNSDNYKQTDQELEDNQRIIKELIKDAEIDSLALIKILFILSIGKNFETPYTQFIKDVNQNKNEKKNVQNTIPDSNKSSSYNDINNSMDKHQQENTETTQNNGNLSSDDNKNEDQRTQVSEAEIIDRKTLGQSIKDFFKKHKEK